MIVVTGGAGYIGSYVVSAFLAEGRQVLVVDDLRTGHADMLKRTPHLREDLAVAHELVDWNKAQGVIHLAAASQVAESFRRPDYYRQNNFEVAKIFLQEAVRNHVPIVYSSTAAVYGEPEQSPILETHPTVPLNPYGESKLLLETWLREHAEPCAVLRYFNAAGGLERHDPETHLIPLLRAGTGDFSVFGDDYPTPDGTCVRDFVHVEDLARAHVLALGKSGVWNLGSGEGTSVLELVRLAGRTPRVEGRRRGDPARLVADISRARAELGWEPRLGLVDMLRDHRAQ